MDGPPPPPPPHGENPKSSGLPPGKYDIFIIPPHSSGSGFLYLPSLKPNVNSFAAGFASALLLVLVSHALAPAIMAWWNSIKGAGGAGMMMFVVAIGVGAWSVGRMSTDGGPGPGGGANPGSHGWQSPPSSGPSPNGHAGPPPNYGAGFTPGAGPMPGAGAPPPGAGAGAGQRSQWHQRSPPGSTNASGGNPGPDPSTPGGGTSRQSTWEKAREETKRKEEERRAREADAKRKAEIERKLREAREKDAREREAREKKRRDDEAAAAAAKRAEELRQEEIKRKEEEVKRQEEESREKRRQEEEALEKKRKDIEAMEQRLKEAREKETRERIVRESKLKYEAAKEKTRRELEEKRKKDEALREQMRKDTEARAAKRAEEESKPRGSTEDETYSYRPYDKPKKPVHKKSLSSLYSESSYAASQSTSRTTPPPSRREPYTNKDPSKIVIKAVYAYMPRAYKTPCSQLISGVGNITDGLILRCETEGLFIDDDVRGVGQREWDAKAWGLKLIEVWCPSFRHSSASTTTPSSSAASSPFASSNFSSTKQKQNAIRRLWGLDKEKPASAEETDVLVAEMLHLCSTNCRFRPLHQQENHKANRKVDFQQTGEMKSKKLHILRVTVRDPDGKRFVFIINESEAWKIAVGIQKLRKSSLIRSMGVSGMSTGDSR
ncbi:uncharacterized protein LY89DRAFT_715382, partial [Mollisia scopiformis]